MFVGFRLDLLLLTHRIESLYYFEGQQSSNTSACCTKRLDGAVLREDIDTHSLIFAIRTNKPTAAPCPAPSQQKLPAAAAIIERKERFMISFYGISTFKKAIIMSVTQISLICALAVRLKKVRAKES